MQALIGLTWLLLFQVLGELLARILATFGLSLPGPVIGLLVLWPLLSVARIRQPITVVAQFLLTNLSLLFVPVGVGVIIHLDSLAAVWWKVLVILVLSTVIGLVVSAYCLRLKPSVLDAKGPAHPGSDHHG
jgi:holin-like protein